LLGSASTTTTIMVASVVLPGHLTKDALLCVDQHSLSR
jgi:hypothetical protein